LNITEIRIKLTSASARNKLKAYCSVTFDHAFVVRDLKIIEGGKGLFIAMPSRKLADRCPSCSNKNHLRAAYCNACGERLNSDRAPTDERGRARLHADLAHPINSACRIALHRSILQALDDEIERSQKAGYVAPSFDDLDELGDTVDEDYLSELAARRRDRDGGAAGEVGG